VFDIAMSQVGLYIQKIILKKESLFVGEITLLQSSNVCLTPSTVSLGSTSRVEVLSFQHVVVFDSKLVVSTVVVQL
jgi:hypothetical protein